MSIEVTFSTVIERQDPYVVYRVEVHAECEDLNTALVFPDAKILEALDGSSGLVPGEILLLTPQEQISLEIEALVKI